MNRRSFLGWLAGGLATTVGTAGCLGGTTGVVSTSVEHVDPRRLRERRATIVDFDEAARAVRIRGFMYYGSSSCNRVGIDAVEYDVEARDLRVVLASTDRNPIPSACTADMAATWYRVTVEFADDLPRRVTVVEEGSGEEGATRTVDRAEQRRLCTTDHPEGANESIRAHWTCPERYVASEESAGVRTPAADSR